MPTFSEVICDIRIIKKQWQQTTVTKYPSSATLAFYAVSVNLYYSDLPKPQLHLGYDIMGKEISSCWVLYKQCGKCTPVARQNLTTAPLCLKFISTQGNKVSSRESHFDQVYQKKCKEVIKCFNMVTRKLLKLPNVIITPSSTLSPTLTSMTLKTRP